MASGCVCSESVPPRDLRRVSGMPASEEGARHAYLLSPVCSWSRWPAKTGARRRAAAAVVEAGVVPAMMMTMTMTLLLLLLLVLLSILNMSLLLMLPSPSPSPRPRPWLPVAVVAPRVCRSPSCLLLQHRRSRLHYSRARTQRTRACSAYMCHTPVARLLTLSAKPSCRNLEWLWCACGRARH